MRSMIYIIKQIGFILICSLTYIIGYSQELESRAINNLPVGTIEDLNSNIHSGLLAYVRSIRFFDLSAKVDVVIPFILGDWEGSINGQEGFRTQNGFGDVRLRFSFNFLGSKAMDISEFQNYKPKNVSGLSVQIIVPTGNYDPGELINVGSNRWAIKP